METFIREFCCNSFSRPPSRSMSSTGSTFSIASMRCLLLTQLSSQVQNLLKSHRRLAKSDLSQLTHAPIHILQDLIKSILLFTRKLLDSCLNRNLYNSVEVTSCLVAESLSTTFSRIYAASCGSAFRSRRRSNHQHP